MHREKPVMMSHSLESDEDYKKRDSFPLISWYKTVVFKKYSMMLITLLAIKSKIITSSV